MSRSSLNVKVTGESLSSQEKNVTTVLRPRVRVSTLLLGRIAAIASDSDIGLLLQTECCGRCVCLSVGHVQEPSENG